MTRRCVDCGRRLDRPAAGWDHGRPVGPKCWAARGAGPTKRAATWKPSVRVSAAADEIDLLDVLAEMGAEGTLTSDDNDH